MTQVNNRAQALDRLKDFQRNTVEHVFRRMYTDPSPSTNFLIADEVGLGKTLVAQGIILRTIEHLQQIPDVERINVVYVCSNAAIAKQNLNRLKLDRGNEMAFATRLTLLPCELHQLRENKVNFISFTPGTTFELKSSGGIAKERLLLLKMLQEEELDYNGLSRMLQGGVLEHNWQRYIKERRLDINEHLKSDFLAQLRRDSALFHRLKRCAEEAKNFPGWSNLPKNLRHKRNEIIGELRKRLAKRCVEFIEPDLIIFDEFQRFDHLLYGDSEASELAQEMINYSNQKTEMDSRVLLLSATPYKMLTLNHETEENHYEKFLQTVSFLYHDDSEIINAVKQDLADFRQGLMNWSNCDTERLKKTRESLQRRLSKVMTRTERIVGSASGNAMLKDCKRLCDMHPKDLLHAASIHQIAEIVGACDTVEYWKSAPYLFNFMRGYKLKEKLIEEFEKADRETLRKIKSAASTFMLSRKNVESYQTIDSINGRLRMLIEGEKKKKAWKLLWLPPSLPYTKPQPPFSECREVTKSLIFSAWKVVPQTIAALCSYETEREVIKQSNNRINYSELYTSEKPLLKFATDENSHPNNMTTLSLLYPCPSLASCVDPITWAAESEDNLSSPSTIIKQTAREIELKLNELHTETRVSQSNQPDARWHWAALALLDKADNNEAAHWLETWEKSESGEEEEHSDKHSEEGFRHHVERLKEAFDEDFKLGQRPQDLARILAELTLGSPAICAVRALRRIAPELSFDNPALLSAASKVASGFRSLFSAPVNQLLIRGIFKDNKPYWQHTLRYAIAGNLQAVLDEYFHVLYESLGLFNSSAEEAVENIASEAYNALTLKASSFSVDEIKVEEAAAGQDKNQPIDSYKMRCKYALPFGAIRDDNNAVLVRAAGVRNAFNSPFRPFILATTSVGQEGLDFHSYCHRVWHWNLPSNPVDLEQREGRVQRYKGHAVRKNVARRFGREAGRNETGKMAESDIWQRMFHLARNARAPDLNDLQPYWIFESLDDPVYIERIVPMLPYSRECNILQRLKQNLAVYRLAFGQPRQEDFLSWLSMFGTDEDSTASTWRIRLDPPNIENVMAR